jgi:hypothetical protein
LFFVLVLVILSVNWAGRGDPELQLGTTMWGRLAPVAGVLLGVIWQLLDRRDLADRLLVPALGFSLMVTLHFASSGVFTRLTGLFLGLGVVAGLILSEQWLRRSAKVAASSSDGPGGSSAVPSRHI